MKDLAKSALPWHIVEAAIVKEKNWLRSVLDFDLRTAHDVPIASSIPLSEDEMLRQISISILNGKIRAREIKSSRINGLWTDDPDGWEWRDTEERHGEVWHRAMMHLIKKHFSEQGFEVVNEPFLAQGRADLGVYKEGYRNMYVEVGSTSLFKTWINLHSMPESIILFVPSVYYALEFEIK